MSPSDKYQKYRQNPVYVLNYRMRHRLRKKLTSKNQQSWTDLVGYTVDELRAHIEAQFKPGMSWDNMSEWHIDHIRPLASFNYTTTECPNFKEAWALSNLQPLWASDNQRKSDKWSPR